MHLSLLKNDVVDGAVQKLGQCGWRNAKVGSCGWRDDNVGSEWGATSFVWWVPWSLCKKWQEECIIPYNTTNRVHWGNFLRYRFFHRDRNTSFTHCIRYFQNYLLTCGGAYWLRYIVGKKWDITPPCRQRLQEKSITTLFCFISFFLRWKPRVTTSQQQKTHKREVWY